MKRNAAIAGHAEHARRATPALSAFAALPALRSRAGFTLIELIAAVAITALISGAAIMIFTNVTATQGRLDAQMARHQEARAAIDAIASALHNLHRSDQADQIVFEGTEDTLGSPPMDRLRLRGVSRRPIRTGEPEWDVHELEFFLHPGSIDRPPALMRRTDPVPNLEREADRRGGVLERVAEHVVGLELSYLAGGLWERDWPEERSGTPAAVRVEVMVLRVDEQGDAIDREPLIVRRLIHFPRRAEPGQTQWGGAS